MERASKFSFGLLEQLFKEIAGNFLGNLEQLMESQSYAIQNA